MHMQGRKQEVKALLAQLRQDGPEVETEIQAGATKTARATQDLQGKLKFHMDNAKKEAAGLLVTNPGVDPKSLPEVDICSTSWAAAGTHTYLLTLAQLHTPIVVTVA